MATLFLDTSSKKLYLGIDSYFADFDLHQGLCEELPSCLGSVCSDAGKNIQDIKRIVYCNGPGSFTGLRTGLSFCKGFSHVKDMPMYGVSLFLSRGYQYARSGGVDENQKFHLYVSANASELFVCEMSISVEAGDYQIQTGEIRVVAVADFMGSMDTKKVSLDIADLPWNPVMCLHQFYSDILAVQKRVRRNDFRDHLVIWNSREVPPAPLYGKGIQARTLRERGIVLHD